MMSRTCIASRELVNLREIYSTSFWIHRDTIELKILDLEMKDNTLLQLCEREHVFTLPRVPMMSLLSG